MKILVIPDGAMIIINFIGKKGHTYISPNNFSKRTADDGFWDKNNIKLPLTSNLDNKHTVFEEMPSGVIERSKLFNKTVKNADACVILGSKPKNYTRMYGILNELILFGTNGCINEHKYEIKTVMDLNIPKLILKYPNNRNEIINLINNLNNFLDKVEFMKGNIIINNDNLNVDLKEEERLFPISEFKNLINNL